jgi:glycosyltransferase involved in cell wall biosynthesis
VKVVLVHRVLHHWRTPVYRRLARWPGIDFLALHGADFPGTKSVNGRDLSGFAHRQLPTWRLISRISGEREIALPFFPTLLCALRRARPDVILADGGSNLLNNCLVILYSRLSGVPIVWWTLGEVRHPGRLGPLQRLFRWLVAAMDRRGAALVGYSSQALAYFERIGIPGERRFRAVNCVDTERVASQIEAARERVPGLRRRLGLEGRTVLLFVGALAPYKRVEDLIAVYAELRRERPELALVVVGGGGHRGALEGFAAEQGAADVVFAGEVVEDVAAWFQLGDVFVLPGLGGLAISEAMVHGLPVVVPEADGSERDLVEEGGNGWLFRRGDRGELRRHLERLAADAELRRRMGERSRWIIQNRYNIQSFMQNLVGALEYAAAGRQLARSARAARADRGAAGGPPG